MVRGILKFVHYKSGTFRIGSDGPSPKGFYKGKRFIGQGFDEKIIVSMKTNRYGTPWTCVTACSVVRDFCFILVWFFELGKIRSAWAFELHGRWVPTILSFVNHNTIL